nr:MAG TPA: protein of unknown function DUF4536 [Caudoviricetes sp.]
MKNGQKGGENRECLNCRLTSIYLLEAVRKR